MQAGQIVLVDTSIIIEAFRTNCWSAISTHFALETVDKCYEEALTGDRGRAGYVEVDAESLRRGLKARHKVGLKEKARLALAYSGADGLDAGERDLFAHALARADAWLTSASDRAAVRAALSLGWEERLHSLEALAKAAGARPTIRDHFTEKWLSLVRTDHKLGRLL